MLDSALDARHSLNVQPRRKLTQHLSYPLVVERLSKHFGRVSDDDDTGPDTPYETIDALGAPVVELHTGRYCERAIEGDEADIAAELDRIARAARHGAGLGLEVHAGHGLTLDSVGPVAALPELAELNIGHSLIAEAIFVGLRQAVRDMRAAMDAARGEGS